MLLALQQLHALEAAGVAKLIAAEKRLADDAAPLSVAIDRNSGVGIKADMAELCSYFAD
jgi:hypothetical protein